MQGSSSGKLEVAFVANSSTHKVVANMEVDREYKHWILKLIMKMMYTTVVLTMKLMSKNYRRRCG